MSRQAGILSLLHSWHQSVARQQAERWKSFAFRTIFAWIHLCATRWSIRAPPYNYQRAWLADVMSLNETRYSHAQFRRDFRMRRNTFAVLCTRLVQAWHERPDGRTPIQLDVALLVFLYRLATPCSLRTMSTVFGYARGHLLELTQRVSRLITSRCADWIRSPSTDEEWKAMAAGWSQQETQLVNIIGAIDGTHIPIAEPPDSQGEYYNRKGFHSYNVQAICDSHGLFIDVCIGNPGCQNDIAVLYSSRLYRETWHTIPPAHFIIGDGGYVLLEWLLIPYNEIEAANSRERQYYNKQLRKQRVKIEQAFGRLKGRWRKLLSTMEMRNQDDVLHFISCAFLLHNFLERESDPVFEDEIVDDDDVNGVLPPGSNNEQAGARGGGRNPRRNARSVRVCQAIRDNYTEELCDRAPLAATI